MMPTSHDPSGSALGLSPAWPFLFPGLTASFPDPTSAPPSPATPTRPAAGAARRRRSSRRWRRKRRCKAFLRTRKRRAGGEGASALGLLLGWSGPPGEQASVFAGVLVGLDRRADRLPASQQQRWERLRRAILEQAEAFARQGGLYPKKSGRKQYLVLRWWDRRSRKTRQRSLYVGCPEGSALLVALVQDLLTLVQAPAAWERFVRRVGRRGSGASGLREQALLARFLALLRKAEAELARSSSDRGGTTQNDGPPPCAPSRPPPTWTDDHGESRKKKKSSRKGPGG